MSTRILVIGQAPPAVTQSVPYDSTMLYTWFEDVGISKEQAQELFEFDAVYDKFPGYGKTGHLVPTREQMEDYYKRSLKEKIESHSKILVLGTTAAGFLATKEGFSRNKKVVFLLHPSKRNIGLYNKQKPFIQQLLKTLIYE